MKLINLFKNRSGSKDDIKDVQRSRFDILKPEVLAKIRAKNSFGNMKIHGSPIELEEALKFTHIREREKEITNELRQIATKLQKYRLSS